VKWKEAKAALAKRATTERSKADVTHIPPTAPNPKGKEPFGKQESLRPGWNHVVRGGRVV